MMIKTFTSFVVICCASCSLAFGQTPKSDSLKVALTTTESPVKRFDLLNKLVLEMVGWKGEDVDSASTVQMLRIAQQLDNDSLRAISYNWLGSFFYRNKGDNASGLEYYFKALPLAEKTDDKRRISSIYFDMALVYFDIQDNEMALEMTRKGGQNLPAKSHPLYYYMLAQYVTNMTQYFLLVHQPDSAFYYAQQVEYLTDSLFNNAAYQVPNQCFLGASYVLQGNPDKAEYCFKLANEKIDSVQTSISQLTFYNNYIPFLFSKGRFEEGRDQATKLLKRGRLLDNNNLKLAGATYLRKAYDGLHQIDSAYYYSRMESDISALIFSQRNKNKIQSLAFNEQLRSFEEKNKIATYQNQLKLYALLAGLGVLLVVAFILFRNNYQKQKANKALKETLSNLKATQSQLVQSEKMASLGELTAGIAHEIQNPLNFINNFSEVNKELIAEMQEEIANKNYEEVKSIAKDIEGNEEKINHHGKRADAIVKGMLQHSRSSSGEKELTRIDVLADEYFRLAYHGLRAKDKSFNANLKTDFDDSIGKISINRQNIGRVLLNLINNAFYVVHEKKKQAGDGYQPTVAISTRKLSPSGGLSENPLSVGEGRGEAIQITVKDNGNGIPEQVRDKIFQPFFTTKPTGQGTGLGLSLSYDIIKAHGGELKVDTKEGEGTTFSLILPII